MGTTLEDIAYNMAMEEQYLDELYEKHIGEFTEDRLKSYFLSNPKIAGTATKALKTAKNLIKDEHYTPALIYAAIALEITVKNILLKGIVHGLVNNDTAATIITKFAIGYGSPNKFQELILKLLTEHGNVNLSTDKRAGADLTLWAEITHIIKQRNDAVHEGKTFTMKEAQIAIVVAEEMINKVFVKVISTLGLHLHKFEICNCQTSANTG